MVWSCAVLYTALLLAGGILQHESVPLHRAILGHLLPGFGPHEDGVRPHTRVVALRFRADSEEHNGDDHSRSRHGSVQLGRGAREAVARKDHAECEEQSHGRGNQAFEGRCRECSRERR